MRVYGGTFLIAFTTLALEITLTRLLSVITWYHLAFFAISTAMLGMTAGAVTVYLKPKWFPGGELDDALATACLGYAVAVPVSLVALCLTPLVVTYSIMSLFALLVATTACSLPFYASGVAIAAVLTKYPAPIGRLYASDLVGAAAGCLLVLGGLEILDAPSLILLCGAIGAGAALIFAGRRRCFRYRRATITLLVALVLAVPINTATMHGIRPFVPKGHVERPTEYLFEAWNSYSRIVATKVAERRPPYWGASPLAPQDKLWYSQLLIDGGASTYLQRFSSPSDIENLRFDVTNVAYYLRPSGGACIIGVGGGRDVQSALLFGHEDVTGLDVNPIFIDWLQNEFREFAGIADRDEVSLLIAEGRSYLTTAEAQYSVIQMSLIDTWAATGAGAFSLSENGLYTTEAWQIFFRRLAPDGVFTVSRWFQPENLGETGRMVSLAVSSLLQSGVERPDQHVAMVTAGYIATLVLSRRPFTDEDLERLHRLSSDLEYNLAVVPGATPTHPFLQEIVAATSLAELDAAVTGKPYNFEPPTDESPYFFNLLRLRNVRPAFHLETGVIHGNIRATLTLMGLIACLLLVTMVAIVIPLMTDRRRPALKKSWSQVYWSRALYFSLIGAGFMFAEIGLIQRLSVFLGHPLYALGILLFSIVASTGLGSLVSEKLPLVRFPWIALYPLVTVAGILAMRFLLPIMAANMVASPMASKIAAAVLAILPLGLLMGFFFPTGMRLVQALGDAETPWYWALNGVFGVLCSALAVFCAIYSGISVNFYVSAACYGGVLLCLARMVRTSRSPIH